MRSVASIFPNRFGPFDETWCEDSCGPEILQPGFHPLGWIRSLFFRTDIEHFAAHGSTTIPFSPARRIQGLQKKSRNIFWNARGGCQRGGGRVNIHNRKPGFIFDGRWMLGGGFGFIVRFNCCTNSFSASIAVKKSRPLGDVLGTIRAEAQFRIFLNLRNLSTSNFFSVAMRASNREYCHA